MIALEYPKIETLYNRDERFKVVTGELRCPEFYCVNRWMITEKIHGTNVRVALHSDGTVEYGGRNEDAQISTFLLNYLMATFSQDKMKSAFAQEDGTLPEVILFGEGYGPKIQEGGGNYRANASFRLFDVAVAGDTQYGWWWLEDDNVQSVADKLGISTVPYIASVTELPRSREELAALLPESVVARQENNKEHRPEGIVARPHVQLFTRRGQRVMWKLKFKDFA